MDKFIFNADDVFNFEDIFGNEFNIVVLIVEKLTQQNPDSKDLYNAKLSLNKMMESYFSFMQKGREGDGSHKNK